MNTLNNHNSSEFKVYNSSQEKSLSLEFKRCKGQCYLDHAGATLYGESQIEAITKDLKENLYGNPHSINSTSKLTNDAIDIIRLKCLKHFKTNPEEYSLIFTSGATEALKIVAESFNYKNGCFAYLEDNHTSVLGMRDYAIKTHVVLCDEAESILNTKNIKKSNLDFQENNSLFVYPAQSNFCGKKYPLTWIKNIQNGALKNINDSKWFCMLDAAAFVSTNDLDLSVYKPDFVCVSFYKIFGYPTGLGALLVKNESANVLIRKYYGGGTVLMTMSTQNIVFRRNYLCSKFEDGTLPFLSILSLKYGFQQLERFDLNMDLISKHTFYLAKYTYDGLKKLYHQNGKPAVILYHDSLFNDRLNQGGIVNFNLLRANGEYIGFAEISYIANLFGIQLRTGCFCNPGACQRYLKLNSKDVFYHFQQGHVCGDQKDLINGTPTGSVRISFGYMSTKKDADSFLKMIQESFIFKHKNGISKPNLTIIQKNINTKYEGILESIYLYPIKSCGFFSVSNSWPLISHGLKYDREFMIADHRGVCLTQKNNSDLCRIKPSLNLDEKNLKITFIEDSITFSLNNSLNISQTFKCQSKLCGDPIEAWNCGEETSKFLSEVLGLQDLKLLRQCLDSKRTRKKEVEQGRLSLVNEAQFLLINRKSVEWLWERINKDDFTDTVEELIERFRPNLVVDFKEAFVENYIKELVIGDVIFKNVGSCMRCQMICINQKTGEKTVEPLRTLSKEFKGKISFGIYLRRDCVDESEIFVNSKVVGICKDG